VEITCGEIVFIWLASKQSYIKDLCFSIPKKLD